MILLKNYATSTVVEEDENLYLGVAEVMDKYGVRKSYVYKLACVHNWRRIYSEMIGYRPYVKYYIEDIDKVLMR